MAPNNSATVGSVHTSRNLACSDQYYFVLENIILVQIGVSSNTKTISPNIGKELNFFTCEQMSYKFNFKT